MAEWPTFFFWSDGRSRINYDYCKYLVVFNTTYGTDGYNLICAPFVGINYHWQNIIFGYAFLLDKTTTSFIWFLKIFLESMATALLKLFLPTRIKQWRRQLKRCFQIYAIAFIHVISMRMHHFIWVVLILVTLSIRCLTNVCKNVNQKWHMKKHGLGCFLSIMLRIISGFVYYISFVKSGAWLLTKILLIMVLNHLKEERAPTMS